MDKDIFYNDWLFLWIVGYFVWEMVVCGMWVILINVLYLFFMVDVVKIVINFIIKEKVIKVFLVLFMFELVMKRKIFLKIKRVIILGVVVYVLFLECIDEICDEL